MAEPKHVPLSEAGEARAKRLASILKDSGVGAIYVTDFVRTNKTAEPLSRELNKELTVLPKGDPRELVERFRKNHGGQTVLLVGHNDTLPGLLKALGYGQMKMLPVSFQEQILPGTFEYTLNHLIDHEIDQAVFEHRYQNDETGAPAYDPAILLKVILCAYSRKERRRCQTRLSWSFLAALAIQFLSLFLSAFSALSAVPWGAT